MRTDLVLALKKEGETGGERPTIHKSESKRTKRDIYAAGGIWEGGLKGKNF